ncbi:MAG: hypothetical protein Q9170_002899 [Blastenia crenularia]
MLLCAALAPVKHQQGLQPQTTIVKLLLQHGVGPNETIPECLPKGESQGSPFQSESRPVTPWRLLLEYLVFECDLRHPDGWLRVCNFFLAHGADPTIRVYNPDEESTVGDSSTRYFTTPLGWAASRGCGTLVELLLSKQTVNPDFEDHYGRTAMSHAAMNGHEVVVKLLHLAKRPRIRPDREHTYGSALRVASAAGHVKVVKTLLDNGADTDTQNGYQGTPLQAASANGHEDVVQARIYGGANINALCGRYEHGGTALQLAAMGEHVRVVQMLLDSGAYIDACDDGRHDTALQRALEKGHHNVAQLLKDSGASTFKHRI